MAYAEECNGVDIVRNFSFSILTPQGDVSFNMRDAARRLARAIKWLSHFQIGQGILQ
jgi:hypothetical protein